MRNIIKHEKLLSDIKMCQEILMFGYIEIEKNEFFLNKIPIF